MGKVTIYSLDILFSQFGTSQLFYNQSTTSNCCFLTHIQVSQETGKMVWYSHLFKNLPQFVVIHTVKSFSVVNQADVFLEFPCFLYDPMNVCNLISACTSGSSQFTYYGSLAWRILSITLLAREKNAVCDSLNILWYRLSLKLYWKLTFSNPVATAEFSKFDDMLSTAL